VASRRAPRRHRSLDRVVVNLVDRDGIGFGFWLGLALRWRVDRIDIDPLRVDVVGTMIRNAHDGDVASRSVNPRVIRG
jgi:hypothetical protein